jgi:predicted RNase H-like HicB family nuclease
MVLEWDARDEIFISTIPEFRGARSHGNTYRQAARMGREVMEMFVDHAREDGETLPPVLVFRRHRVEATGRTGAR